MILASPHRRARSPWLARALLGALLAATMAGSWARTPPAPGNADVGGVIGLREAYLDPAFWAARLPEPDRVILDRAGIAAQNARMRAEDRSIHDLRALPAQLPRAQVLAQIQALSTWPDKATFGQDGAPIAPAQRSAAIANLALGAVPAQRPLQYGLVTHRAALRTFPTALRVFTSRGDTDIDRFQESALFPGDAVAVLHESADGQWWFITSERYSAWIEKRFVGIGDAATVLGYGQRGPYRVITGATAHTAYTPEQPRVSRLQLDMGVRLPVLADWPVEQTVNGQQAHAGYVLQLPVRNDDGSLALVPALLPRSQDSAADYLPLTPRNLLAQAFKFLGERYGWGHDYDTRDCSGFVSEIYRSFGVLMPRNTSAQAVSPALDRIAFAPEDGKARRDSAVGQLQVGDLVYIPGHVMVAIGHLDGRTWLIHDTAGGSWSGAGGKRVQAHLNGVSVTPLEPMMASDTVSYIDRITNIQRIRPQTPE
ncbi:SH3 domain-containing protein [Stenotrophomonas rhizophila]|uniref:SH3 domain-containing protein n=1 Tax=Stenotrophomonas rhizophila TaxID=216778 RepID=UPI001E539898|nr:SH3 domain-containing protein [Stenotrophomonas rhizophila]MCC7635740.1 SH3 domain-containing protein [Stenotrophomonas rhizophila]MCC7664997.1 SH3 domain-containing protein [Stenotrophomonas rhizophila]